MDYTLSVAAPCREGQQTHDSTWSNTACERGFETLNSTVSQKTNIKETLRNLGEASDVSNRRSASRDGEEIDERDICKNSCPSDSVVEAPNVTPGKERDNSFLNRSYVETKVSSFNPLKKTESTGLNSPNASYSTVWDTMSSPLEEITRDSPMSSPSESPNYMSPMLSPQLRPAGFLTSETLRKPNSVPLLRVDSDHIGQIDVKSCGGYSEKLSKTDYGILEKKDEEYGLSGLSPSSDKLFQNVPNTVGRSKALQPIGSKVNSQVKTPKKDTNSQLLFHVDSVMGSDYSPKKILEETSDEGFLYSTSLSSQMLTSNTGECFTSFNVHHLGNSLHREEQVRNTAEYYLSSSYSPFESPSLARPLLQEKQKDEQSSDMYGSRSNRLSKFENSKNERFSRSSCTSAMEKNEFSFPSVNVSPLKQEDVDSPNLASSYRGLWQGSNSQTIMEKASPSYDEMLNAFRALECSEGEMVKMKSPNIGSPIHANQSLLSNPTTNGESHHLLKNIPPGVDDNELRRLLEYFGPLRELGAQQRSRGGRGAIQATFFDLRHARDAVKFLDQSTFRGRVLDVRFILSSDSVCASPASKRGNSIADNVSPYNNGTLVVFNLDPNTTADELRQVFGSYGDIKEIRESPHKRHHKISRPGGIRGYMSYDSVGTIYSPSSPCHDVLEEESSTESLDGVGSRFGQQYWSESCLAALSALDSRASSEQFVDRSYGSNSSKSSPVASNRSTPLSFGRETIRPTARSLSSPLFLSQHSPSRLLSGTSNLEGSYSNSFSNGMMYRRSSGDDRCSKFILDVEKVRSGEDLRTA
eukprot:jgi/Galph1/1524/GphlegSOOS_G208.1